MKIRPKLTLGIILIVLIPFIFISLTIIKVNENSLKNQIITDLTYFAEAKEGQVFAYLDSIESRTIDFSSDGFIRDSLKEIINTGSAKAVEALNKQLIENKKPLDKTIVGISVVDRDGKIVASTHNDEIGKDESSDEYFIEGKKGVFAIELGKHEHFSLMHIFVVSAPLTDKKTGELLGVIINIFDIEKIQKILSGMFQLEEGALTSEKRISGNLEVYLVDKEKIMFIHPNEIGDKHFTGMIVDTLPVQKCLNNQEEITGEYIDYKGEKVFGASMCFADRKWTLIAEFNAEEVLLPLKKLRNTTFIIGFFYVLLVGLSGYIFSNTISKPIKRLHEGIEIIAKGNFDYKTNIRTKDEIGELSKAFDAMSSEIKESRAKLEKHHEELERQIKERTRQLQEKIKEADLSKQATMNIMEDVDETNKKLLEAQEKLKQNLKELEKLDFQKDQFISIAAHELKTPLTSIKGFADLLIKGNVAENPQLRNKYLGIIFRDTKRLGGLITNILELSRMDIGTLKLALEDVKIQDLMNEVKEQMNIIIKNKNLDSEFKVQKNLPTVSIDKDKTIQVISNLINNAVHYTDKGKITVEAKRKENDILFSVSDTGIGIPKQHLKIIFERFYQVDNPLTRKIGGTGLGLSLCKGFVEAMGGKIWVESKVGKGSTFYFTIPIKRKQIDKSKYVELFGRKSTTSDTLKEIDENPYITMDYAKLIELIIKYVEKLIGPMAIAAANQLQGLEVNKDGKVTKLSKDGREVLSKLIKQYEKVIGPIGRLIADREIRSMLEEEKIIAKPKKGDEKWH
jgi:two-component system sensor histidine kinase VicK